MMLVLALVSPVWAHEVRPAYLQLQQTGAETYDVLWKVPGRGEDMRLALYVELPDGCVNLSEPRGVLASGAHTEKWIVRCADGLDGRTIRIAGLSATLTDVLVRVERLNGATQTVRLTPASTAFVVVRSTSTFTVPAVADSSVSGRRSFATTSAAGADMTDAAMRCSAGAPKAMYAPMTLPAIVAKPPVMPAWSSESVIPLM